MEGSSDTAERGDGSSYPSLRLIYELALAQWAGRLERIDAADSKIATLLGFTAVIVALLLNAEFVVDGWNWVTTAGAALLLLGVVVLFVAFRAHRYRRDPDLSQFREQYQGLPVAETQLRVVDNLVDAIRQNDATIEGKAKLANVAALLALVGLLLVAVRTVYLLQGGHS
jgi:hypothetical protein